MRAFGKRWEGEVATSTGAGAEEKGEKEVGEGETGSARTLVQEGKEGEGCNEVEKGEGALGGEFRPSRVGRA